MNAKRRRDNYRRVGAGLVAFGIAIGGVGAFSGLTLIGPADVASAANETSAQTKSWVEGDTIVGERDTRNPDYQQFEDLEVTVAQTTNLSDQGVVVTWTGGKPTTPNTSFDKNYLQIMQCWGDDEAEGPTPDKCQYGASTSTMSQMLGTRVASRSLGAKTTDPDIGYLDENGDPIAGVTQEYDESFHRLPANPARPGLRSYAVPFVPVSGDSVFDVATYFNSATTNEVSAVRTSADGTGQSVFQLQSSLTAPHLGCGATKANGEVRSCWLVIVPRGVTSTDGAAAESPNPDAVAGSPLSTPAWSNRIVFKMDFTPTAAACTIGSTETRLVGHEEFTDAMTSYQAEICPSGTTLGYSQLGDDEAKAQLISTSESSSSLAAIATPLSKDEQGDLKVAYAPIAQNAVVVGYNIDRDYRVDSELIGKQGTPVENLTLNARLIAKLLTQSYRSDVADRGNAEPLTNNPMTILRDPEFTELNPEFAEFNSSASPQGLIVSLGSSDDIAQVWSWLKSDPYAAAFLKGAADQWGMKINPAYLALDIMNDATINSFPKADLAIAGVDENLGAPGYGTLDMLPYAQDFNDSGYRAARADAGTKIVWDTTKAPPQYVSSGSQLPGHRFQLSLTTRTSAERYGLNTAKLVNSAGQAVAPSDESISTAIAAFSKSEVSAEVSVPNNGARVLDAYPLPTLTHAAVAYCQADSDSRAGYVKLLNYLVGQGQQPGHARGQLPVGYVPLSAAQIASVKSLVSLLSDTAAIAKSCAVEQVEETPEKENVSATSDEATDPVDQQVEDAETVDGDVVVPVDATDEAATSAELYAGNTSADSAGIRGVVLGLSASLGLPALLGGTLLLRRANQSLPSKI